MQTASTRRSRVQLTVSSPTEAPEPEGGRIPSVPWLVAAVSWSAGVALLGLAAVAVGVLAVWLTALDLPAPVVLDTVVQLWVATQGVDALVAEVVVVGVTPLGITLVLVAACAAAAHHAAVQALGPGATQNWGPWRRWGAVVSVCTASYTVVSWGLALWLAHPGQALPTAGGAVVISGVGAAVGAMSGSGVSLLEGRPAWVRRLPRAVGVGCAVLVAGSTLALVVNLVAHWNQVSALHHELAPDVVGTIVLIVIQLAYLPNLIVWAGSWALGAGVSLGAGTVVGPGVTSVGLLPMIPVLGALPVNGEAWSWLWMLVGTAAGVAAAVELIRGLPAESAQDLEGWPWQAGLAGLMVGAAWSVFAFVSRGDLGVARLVGLGPRFPDIVWLASMGVGLAAAAAGIVCFGLAQRRLPPPDGDEVAGDTDELVP